MYRALCTPCTPGPPLNPQVVTNRCLLSILISAQSAQLFKMFCGWWLSHLHIMHPQLILEVACWAQWGGGLTAVRDLVNACKHDTCAGNTLSFPDTNTPQPSQIQTHLILPKYKHTLSFRDTNPHYPSEIQTHLILPRYKHTFHRSKIQTHIILSRYEHTLSAFHCTESMSYVISISV